MSEPTVFVVDDDPAVRDSLGLLLETAGLSADCHDSAESFLAAYDGKRPACVILDVRMQQMSGPELQAELIRRGLDLPIIFLTAHGDLPMTGRALKAGAKDFLTKPLDGTELLDRVHAALRDEKDIVSQRRTYERTCRCLEELTQREHEVMMLALAGQTNKAIARQLGISHRTVELHRSHILQKPGAANMLELAQLASHCGLTFANGGETAAGRSGT
jgi:FixJ family two-component response regulator